MERGKPLIPAHCRSRYTGKLTQQSVRERGRSAYHGKLYLCCPGQSILCRYTWPETTSACDVATIYTVLSGPFPPTRVSLLTLAAHAQRGLEYLVGVSVCPFPFSATRCNKIAKSLRE